MAFEREWPEPEFIQEVEEAFPDQGIASVEEARVGLLTLYHYNSNEMPHHMLILSICEAVMPLASAQSGTDGV